jgi:hypothetical protein
MKQDLSVFHEHLSLPSVFDGVRAAHLFSFFVLSYYVSLRSEFCVLMFITISAFEVRLFCSPVVTYPVISLQWEKDRDVFTTSGIYLWSFMTQLLYNGQPSHGGDRKIDVFLTVFVFCGE